MATTRQQSKGQPSGVLLRKGIIDLGIISENAKDECFKVSSYDLRIGSEYLNTDGEQTAIQVPLRDCTVVVPPLGSVIVSTHEVVRIPRNVIGKFNLRIKLAVKGLFVQMGTQVEPYYEGRLFATLLNVSADPIELKLNEETDERERLFTIEFFYTNGDAEEPEEAKKYLHLRDFIQNLSFTRSPLSTLIDSFDAAEPNFKATQALIDDAKETIESTAAERLSETQAELKSWAQEQVKTSVQSELQTQSKNWKKFAFEFGVMGIGVVAFATILPIAFSIAMERARTATLSDDERTMGGRISVIETGLDALRDTLSGNERLEALSERLEIVNTTVQALKLENANMRREIEEARRLGYTQEQNPSTDSEVEQ